MPGAQVQRDDEYLSVQIPVPNPQKVTYISAIKGRFLQPICIGSHNLNSKAFHPCHVMMCYLKSWLVLVLEKG